MDSTKAWASDLWSFQGPVPMSTVSQTTFKEGRYRVSLPWKPESRKLPENHRMRALRKWLKGCNPVLRVQQSRGLRKTAHNVKYYLPHHAARREDKVTTPLRVVFGASCHKDDSLSLNECLLTETNPKDRLCCLLASMTHWVSWLPSQSESSACFKKCGKEDSTGVRSYPDLTREWQQWCSELPQLYLHCTTLDLQISTEVETVWHDPSDRGPILDQPRVIALTRR